MAKEIVLGYDGITLADLVVISRDHARVAISEDSIERIAKTRKLIEKWVGEEKVIYGITTGFGALSDVIISKEDTAQLQINILMSHSAGVGRPLDEETVRGTMALRIKDFARGHSGISRQTVDHLVTLLNHNICPVMPEKGSVGASGDLAPLAHLGLVLIGLGEAFVDGRPVSGAEALRKAGLSPLKLGPGEGLALVNGTQVMTAIAALATYDAQHLARITDIAAAMSLEVLMGSRTEFHPLIHQVRPHPGQATSADNMARITQGSEIITSHKDCKRVQDAYTLRCSPQVHGASKDVINFAKGVVETEMNSSTNNPLIFADNANFLLGGNFHGQPIALAMDSMCMAVAELANISERRIERLVNPMLSGLPAFLVADGGLNSGFMIAQYTAASLVAENKALCHPVCVDSIPTSANKEDHVSFGTISARKCREVVNNTQHVLAIELLCAAQALDLFTNMKPGKGTLAAYRLIRDEIPHLEKDRIISTDIKKMLDLIRSGRLLAEVERVVGKLN
ncbi:MAG: histidine ammonia-lyase [Deltaproteobacteria bacterium]|nr:histidine ammonia-lyase [Deltaproteobacteria bacterium]MBW2082401.1 histidine ammonia-lyase [Deltaproteobacteria bacterium]